MASSSATVRVEKATSDLLIGPDWTMNMEICDSINSDHWQAKDVVKAVKKRLQHKNPRVQFLTLTLLETMMKNCGDSVHFLVVDRDILQEMVKIVKKKMDMQVRGKILVLLDSWQEAFGGPGGKYPQYYWAYTELRRYGIQFPQRSADAVPMFTPSVTHPVPTHPPVGYGMPSHSSIRLEEAMASEMGNLSISDLDSIRSVMELLSDMLQAVNVNDRMAVKDDVIVDLVGQCRSNQKKLMHLVNSTVDEELLAQGLALNDSLQMLLTKHDAIASGSLPSDANSSVLSPNTPTMPVTVVSKHSDDEDDEDDGFSQLARRNERAHVVPSQSSVSTSGPEPLSDKSITTVASTITGTSGTAESSGSAPDLALALPDPPASVRTSNKEQDMIDLLSITLSSNPSPPHTPLTPPTVSSSGSHVPFSPSTPGYPYNPQPNPVNQGFLHYNNYVVPWAQQVQPQPQPRPQFQQQPQPRPQFQQQPRPQFQQQPQPQPQFQQQPQPQPQFQQQPQPQPQFQQQPQPQFQQQPQPQPQFQQQPQPQPQVQQQPQSQSQFQQQPQPQTQLQQQPQPQSGLHPNFQSPQPQIPQYSLKYPPPPWANQESAVANYSPSNVHQPAPISATMNVSTQSFRPMQPSYSFGRGNNVPMLGETRVNANHRQPATGASAKPFIPSYRLFEDLVELRNPGGGLKTGGLPPNLSGPSNQNMVGRK